MSDYSPPSGNLVALNFTGAGYVAPAGNLVGLEFTPGGYVPGPNQYVFPVAINSSAYGAASVFNHTGYVLPTSFTSNAYGAPSVRNASQGVSTTGFTSAAYGVAFVQLLKRYVQPVGFLTTAYGTAVVQNSRNIVVNASAGDTSKYGTANVQLENRNLTEVTMGQLGAVGAATVWYRVRTIGLTDNGIGWLTGKQFGATTVRDAKQTIPVPGIPPGDVGQPTTYRNERAVLPLGFTGTVGNHTTYLKTQVAGARPVADQDVYGTAIVFNSRQIVTQIYDPTAIDTFGYVGTPLLVENRNKVITNYGFNASLYGRPAILNNARVIYPAGIDSLAAGRAMAAYRIRYVGPQGFESFYMSIYNGTYNGSRILYPSGIGRNQTGVPYVFSNTQWLKATGGSDTSLYGTAMVAPAIRYVNMTVGLVPPYMPDVDVQLLRRYVAPAGFEGVYGVPDVFAHRNIIATKGYPQSAYGEPNVKNKTPTVAVYATLLTEYGKPTVINRNFYLPLEGFSTIWGSTLVDFKLKTIKPGGFNAGKISALNDVRFDAPQIPPTLNAYPSGIADPMYLATSNHVVSLRGAVPAGIEPGRLGTPSLVSYGIGPVFIQFVDLDMFGTPTLNYPQSAAPQGIPIPLNQVSGFPYTDGPYVSPHTIRLDVNIAPQYTMDYEIDQGEPHYPFWGNADVSLQNRSISMVPKDGVTNDMFAAGTPNVDLKKRTIYPVGFKTFKYGVPIVPSDWTIMPYWGRDTEDEIPGVDIDPARYGAQTVAYAELRNRPVYPGPMDVANQDPTDTTPLPGFGAMQVDLFNRVVSPQGFIATRMSNTADVHPPYRYLGLGFDSFTPGTAWVSFRVRRVYPDNLDLDTRWGVDYEQGGGVYPMTVRFVRSTVAPAGIPPNDVGDLSTGLFRRYISPAGLVSGSFPAPTLNGTLKTAPGGFNSLAMGTPAIPVYGTIRPHGDDMARYGVGHLNLGVHAPYIEPGSAGTPNVRRGVLPLGLEGVFGHTVVVGESNCGNALAVAATMGSMSNFGQPGVHR